MTRLLHVVGARPNFMKAAAVIGPAGCVAGVEQILIHTGQHYDPEMSEAHFRDLGLPRPDVNLGVGSGSQAAQTAAVMTAFEPVLAQYRPDWVVVYGDVNSTVACALVAAKMGVRVAHVEAGLRSRDRTMPEELNRIVTDQLADLLLTPSRDANDNLRREGIPAERIRFAGNVMVDTLLRLLDRARARRAAAGMGLEAGCYAFVTMHRPANVDDPAVLAEILAALDDASRHFPIVFAAHPRTVARIDHFGLRGLLGRVRVVPPLGYLDSVSLTDSAAMVITDSGGLQEETTTLGVPCITVRPNTERPVTVSEGTNRLVTSTRAAMVAAVNDIVERAGRARVAPRRPEGWDGHAGERVVACLLSQDAAGPDELVNPALCRQVAV